MIKAFLRDQSAASAVEYGLTVGGIGVAILAVLASMGTSLAGVFTAIHGALH